MDEKIKSKSLKRTGIKNEIAVSPETPERPPGEGDQAQYPVTHTGKAYDIKSPAEIPILPDNEDNTTNQIGFGTSESILTKEQFMGLAREQKIKVLKRLQDGKQNFFQPRGHGGTAPHKKPDAWEELAEEQDQSDRDQTGRKDSRDYPYGEDPLGNIERKSKPGNDRETRPETRDDIYERYERQMGLTKPAQPFVLTEIVKSIARTPQQFIQVADSAGLASFQWSSQTHIISPENKRRVCRALCESSKVFGNRKDLKSHSVRLLRDNKEGRDISVVQASERLYEMADAAFQTQETISSLTNAAPAGGAPYRFYNPLPLTFAASPNGGSASLAIGFISNQDPNLGTTFLWTISGSTQPVSPVTTSTVYNPVFTFVNTGSWIVKAETTSSWNYPNISSSYTSSFSIA